MKREHMAQLAQEAADAVVWPNGARLRVVCIVTDERGDFVGVGTTTGHADTINILRCAIAGGDLQMHPKGNG